jgi:hypothetical protein
VVGERNVSAEHDIDRGRTEFSENYLSHCHFIDHKSHMNRFRMEVERSAYNCLTHDRSVHSTFNVVIVIIITIIIIIIYTRNSTHVICKTKSGTSVKRVNWNHFKIIQTLPEHHTGKPYRESMESRNYKKLPYWALHPYFGKY